MRRLLWTVTVNLGLATALVGCGSADGADPSADAGPDPAPVPIEGVSLVFYDEAGAAAPPGEGGLVPWMWGQQGGSMIRPALLLEAGIDLPPGELEVLIAHEPLPGAESSFGVDVTLGGVPFISTVEVEPDGRLRIGPFDDQLAWEALDDTRHLFRMTVEGTSIEVERALLLEDHRERENPFADDPCKPFSPGLGVDGGCIYADLPVVARVVAREDPPASNPPDACFGTVALRLDLSVVDAGALACLASREWGLENLQNGGYFDDAESSAQGPPACADAWGLEVDAEVPAVATLQIEGTCGPFSGVVLALPEDRAPCACAAP
ncbi:MAG: hypothetical protein ACOYM9_03550 [Bradymonadia bacterium]